MNLTCTAPSPPLSAPGVAVEIVTSSTASALGCTTAKKPSELFNRLSWMLKPLSVRLIEPLGNPLMDEVRGVPGVVTPGCVRTSCMASRATKGSSLICRPVMVVATLAVCVCKTSPPPCTMTDSLGAPTSSVTLTVAGVAARICTLGTTLFLKPGASTVTRYTPALSAGTVNAPLLEDVTLNSAPVASFLTITEAPEMAAPFGSIIAPERGAVVPDCPKANKPHAATIIAALSNFSKQDFMC